MSAIADKNTKPELAVRRALWSAGYRYRLHGRRLPGRPDLVFQNARVAVFIDGDFWHGNAWRIRGLDRLEDLFPARTEWWTRKIMRNVERDEEVTELLEKAGWTVIRAWESEVLKDLDGVVRRIALAVDGAAKLEPR